MNLAVIIAGFLSGLIGGMGLGGGAVLLLYLTVFKDVDQLKAQGINLLFFLPIALVAVIIYAVKKQIDYKVVLWLALGGVAGAVGGSYLSNVIGAEIIGKFFATFLIILGIREIISSFSLKVKKKCGILKKE